MKLCYADESGMGDEPHLVIAGVIVDSQRMHITKEMWDQVLKSLSNAASRPVNEFHSRDFYKGNSPWRNISGDKRARIIEALLDWLKARKHKVVFTGIDKHKFDNALAGNKYLVQLKSHWCACAFHLVLALQKQHQGMEKTKGNTIFIFDEEVKEEKYLCDLVMNPPIWSDSFYSKDPKNSQLNQIVDVPYFADSKPVLLIQVADLMAYILRTHSEISDGLLQEKYPGEAQKMAKWAKMIADMTIPTSTRWPKKGRNPAQQLFYDIAPKPLLDLG